MHVDESASERESDTEAAVGAVRGRVALREEIEDPRQPFLRDADAAVSHANLDHIAGPSGGDVDLAAGLGELGGIVQDVGQDLDEANTIAIDHQCLGRNARGDAVLLDLDCFTAGLQGVGDDVSNVNSVRDAA